MTPSPSKTAAPDHRFIIGIDLGTTNSAVSYVDLKADATSSSPSKRVKRFRIAQFTGEGEVSRLFVLPSFYYIPGRYDLDMEAMQLPWAEEGAYIAGAFARDHGARVPARLISSAKSWLCHDRVDREAPILPWGAGDEVKKVSPVAATAAYLNHIRNAWNTSRGQEADDYLENQQVIITVPASFDEVARDLTLKAAETAGFGRVILLEEPLAAFYSWLMLHEKDWPQFVNPGELILICDVGGGTTDFTLVTLRATEGTPRFERLAVGDHLILGGDNMDLALARLVESRFPKGHKALGPNRWKTLCHQCRQAKENILDGRQDARTVTLMGSGGKLIGGTLSARLTREDVENTIVGGFYPLVTSDELETPAAAQGLSEFGLPYAADPAITRHMGRFIRRHQDDIAAAGVENTAPALILFNGGSLKAGVVQQQIRSALRHWFALEDKSLPRVLENTEPDLAVCLGAAYYGLVKSGIGVRVGSGSPRSYYIGVESEAAGQKAVCLVERGLDEGSHISLKDQAFETLTNQPVVFPVFSSSYRSGDRCGDIIDVDESLSALPPIETVIQFGRQGNQRRVPVRIEADYTEIGTLALWCKSLASQHRWRLQFQLRKQAPPAVVREETVFDDATLSEARRLTAEAFENPDAAGAADNVTKSLAALLEADRENWPLSLIRSLADELIERVDSRKQNPELEARWLNLTGFCMRPGIGEGFDAYRVKQLWKMYMAGPLHPQNVRVRMEWWIFWRRLAAGLTAGQQRQFFQDLQGLMAPAKNARSKTTPQEMVEIWMTAANLEYLLAKDKAQLGKILLPQLKPRKTKPQLFWALGRIAARRLLYGPNDRVIKPAIVARWLETLMEKKWRNPRPVLTAVVQMSQMTDDRIRDIDPALRTKIINWCHEMEAGTSLIEKISTCQPRQRENTRLIYGESLPVGLVFSNASALEKS